MIGNPSTVEPRYMLNFPAETAPPGLKLCAVDNAGVALRVAVEARAPELVTSGDRVLGTGTHFRVRGGVDGPCVTAVGRGVNATHASIKVAASGPADLASQEQDRTDRPRPVERPSSPDLTAAGSEMEPPFNVRRNFAAADPSPTVVQEEDGTIKNGIDGRIAGPLRPACDAREEIDAGRTSIQVGEQRKLGIKPTAIGI